MKRKKKTDKKTGGSGSGDALGDARSIRGGSQTKNLTINIGKLAHIDQYSPQSEEINRMDRGQFERWLTEMFMRVVRSAEMMP